MFNTKTLQLLPHPKRKRKKKERKKERKKKKKRLLYDSDVTEWIVVEDTISDHPVLYQHNYTYLILINCIMIHVKNFLETYLYENKFCRSVL
jgi:hypothetical protein